MSGRIGTAKAFVASAVAGKKPASRQGSERWGSRRPPSSSRSSTGARRALLVSRRAQAMTPWAESCLCAGTRARATPAREQSLRGGRRPRVCVAAAASVARSAARPHVLAMPCLATAAPRDRIIGLGRFGALGAYFPATITSIRRVRTLRSPAHRTPPPFSHHFRSDATFDDTMRNGLFGLTQQSWSFVKDIQPGMPLFLYNLTERRFHGVFEAVRAERPQRDPPTLDLAAQQA